VHPATQPRADSRPGSGEHSRWPAGRITFTADGPVNGDLIEMPSWPERTVSDAGGDRVANERLRTSNFFNPSCACVGDGSA